MSEPRLLVVRVGALGDVLHALPGVAALRQQWPGAVIDWVVDTRWAPLLINSDGQGPVINSVHRADTRLWSGRPLSFATMHSIATLRKQLHRRRYDLVIDLQGTLRSAVIGRMAARRAPLAGFRDPRESAARWLYRRQLPRQGVHVVEQGAALLGMAVGRPLQPVVPSLPRDAAAEAWAEELLQSGEDRPVALLAPTAGWGAKQWPAARFGELAGLLAGRGWRVLVNAPLHPRPGPEEDLLRTASGGVGEPVRCSIAELVALVRRAGLVVGGDSGPVHLAAALRRPVVALFGPTDPARNGPWPPAATVAILRHPVSATSYRHSAAPDPGLEQIPVAEVLEASERVTGDFGVPA